MRPTKLLVHMRRMRNKSNDNDVTDNSDAVGTQANNTLVFQQFACPSPRCVCVCAYVCVSVCVCVYKLICLKLLVSLSLGRNFKAIWQAQKFFKHSRRLEGVPACPAAFAAKPLFSTGVARPGAPLHTLTYIYTRFYVLLKQYTGRNDGSTINLFYFVLIYVISLSSSYFTYFPLRNLLVSFSLHALLHT